MFDKILIANRGEIACRVILTARRLGIRTVAVYSEADAGARHVALADEAIAIGPAAASASYLRGEAIIAAARLTGAQAIHPGYGFLSENAGFAEACAAANNVFIGPPPAAIRAMGLKSESKRIMETAGVPLVPGYHGSDQTPALLADEAGRIGFPVLIKASAGGGGKGMRVVNHAAEFGEALSGAQREAQSAFGDANVLVEKYLTTPRHIEIQVFCDSLGNAVYLFERDCSVQRRHQKVLEEAPAPGMTAQRRAAMGDAAVKAAKAIGYVGAGTVEFIADASGEFYFMEMNTRLQVEHPVTEMITGQDLVEWQLRVAGGERLPLLQDGLAIHGHAIEARLYAEDPERDFLPSTGVLRHLRFPSASGHVRVDTGVREGDAVTVHYDPMIAKLIVWDVDRDACLRRLRVALAATSVAGLTTNLDFLAAVADHPAFAAGGVDTGFIGRYYEALTGSGELPPANQAALATLEELLTRRAQAARAAAASDEPDSPWASVDGWRVNGTSEETLRYTARSGELEVRVRHPGPPWTLTIDTQDYSADGHIDEDGLLHAAIVGRHLRARIVEAGDQRVVIVAGRSFALARIAQSEDIDEGAAGGGQIKAPMPGRIVQLRVAVGDTIERGQPLLILEAMKMEHTLTAASAGVVQSVNFAVGDMVDDGSELLVIVAPE